MYPTTQHAQVNIAQEKLQEEIVTTGIENDGRAEIENDEQADNNRAPRI